MAPKSEQTTFQTLSRQDRRFREKQLWNHSLFRELPRNTVRELISEMEVRCLEPGEILIRPGNEIRKLFLLISGRMSVHLDAPDSGDSFVVVPGECVGEMSMVERRPVSAWVVGREPSTLLVMSERTFREKILAIPEAVGNLLEILVRRMRANNMRIEKILEQRLRYEHLQKDLEHAGNIQANILPRKGPLFPNHPQVDVSAVIQPARQVGGDFYDAIALDRDRIAVAIGDVSGKGMPAALFMVRVVTFLRMNLVENDLYSVMPAVNRMACENNDELMFSSLFLAVLNVRTGLLQYVNGGHNPPFISLRGGSFDFLPMSKGIMPGVDEEARYRVDELSMARGDTLVLYTDGVTEAENAAGEFFREPRALDVLNAAHPTDAATLVQALKEEVDRFSTGLPPSDDITLLALRYLSDRT